MLLGPIISWFFACSSEEKNQTKQQKVHALVISLCDLDVQLTGAGLFNNEAELEQQLSVTKNLDWQL